MMSGLGFYFFIHDLHHELVDTDHRLRGTELKNTLIQCIEVYL